MAFIKSTGRTKIYLPLTKNELTAEVIKNYLPIAISIHNENRSDIDYWVEYYKGKQPILAKSRDIDTNINNMILENHAFECVEFKKGFMFGEAVKYTKKETSKSEDIDILNTYMIEQNKASKNRRLAEDYYIFGTGYMMCLPRTGKYDASFQSPFSLYNLNALNTFVAYSTSISQETLFACVLTPIKGDKPTSPRYELKIFTDEKIYTAVYNGSVYTKWFKEKFVLSDEQPNAIGMIPIIEYPLNEARMGIIELAFTIDCAINSIISNNIDDLQQFVNALLLFYNVDLDKTDLSETRATGAATLNTTDPQRPADAKYITKNLSYSEVQKLLEWLVDKQYDLRGVPKASGGVTSGGDTGQARLLGGGWTRADVNVKNDQLAFIESERHLIDVMLNICYNNPNCGINEVSTNDIEITFNINRSDNLLVKTQAFASLIANGIPYELAFNITGIVSDSKEAATLCEKELALSSEKKLESAVELKKRLSEFEKSNETNSTETVLNENTQSVGVGGEEYD